jgi:transposase
MLDHKTRTAILALHEAGHGTRAIARALRVSRGAVKRVLSSRSAEPPALPRAEKAEPYRQEIVELLERCNGNLIRVHEELVEMGAELSYPALTAYCRRHGIGHEPPKPVGRYHFEPGQEMQHDTSPHKVKLGGRTRQVQTASLVLCYSRMLFFQHYPRFNRFTCKLFLTDALRYFGGACGVCMIDNTHVIVASGTGKNMIPAPEMAAFAERLGFVFQAHEKGDANRSARVERPFHYIENNYLAGREFEDWRALNHQAVLWCDKVNATRKRHLHAAPRELFAAEKPRLSPLPLWVPDVYDLHHRIIDSEGYVRVHQNRYSAPWRLIGHRVEVRETKERIEIFDGPRLIASHERVLEPRGTRVFDPKHRPPRGQGRSARGGVSFEEQQLLRLVPELGEYIANLKKRPRSRGLRDIRHLLRMVGEYPREPLLENVRTAAHYGLYDLERVEQMVLRSLASDFFFVVPKPPSGTEADMETDSDMNSSTTHDPATPGTIDPKDPDDG